MPTIIVQGRPVRVSNSFFELSPGEQSATVRDIAERMAREAGAGQPSVNSLARADRSDPAAMAPAWRDGFGLPTPNEASNSERKSDRDLPQPEPSWSDVPKNVVPSAVNAVTGLYETVRHPIRTLQALETVAGGAMNLMGADELNAYLADRGLAARRNPKDVAREEATAKAVGQALKDRYWGLDNLKKTMITDPVGSALDILGVAGGGYGLVRQGLSLGSKARLAEISGPALDAERLAANELGPAVARSNIDWTTGSKSNTIRRTPSGAGPSDEIRTIQNAQDMSTNAFNPPSKPQGSLATDHAQDIKRNEIDEAGNLPVGTGGYPLDGQFAGRIPKETFLTEGLEKKRHNYPSGRTMTDDIRASADATKDRIYAPPNKPQRPFAEDYTNGVRPDQVDAKGNLLVDRRGHPIDSWLTVGRRTLGGDDIGATHQEFRTIGEKLLGKPIEMVPRAQIQNRAGRFRYDRNTRKPLSIFVADDLSELKRNHVTNHEIAHLIDLETGLPPVPPEVLKELEPVYSTLRTQFDWPLILPSHHGYKGPKIRNEMIAEGYRAAITNPNFMKSKAPRAYAWLADQVEKSAKVRKWLVLNGLGAGAVASFWAFGQENESAAAEAPAQHSSKANAVGNTRPTFAPAFPFEPQDKTANLPAYRFPELVKALAARGSFTQSAKSEEFKGLVRALVNREARRRSQSYGGPK